MLVVPVVSYVIPFDSSRSDGQPRYSLQSILGAQKQAAVAPCQRE